MTKHTKKTSTGVAPFLAGAAVAAIAGWLFLGGDEGEKRKKKLRGWMLKAKGEVMDKLEKTENITKDNYEKIVDDVLGKYYKVKTLSEKEVDALRRDLKRHWKRISEEFNSSDVSKKVEKEVKKARSKPKE
jgi:gas vesicle protein